MQSHGKIIGLAAKSARHLPHSCGPHRFDPWLRQYKGMCPTQGAVPHALRSRQNLYHVLNLHADAADALTPHAKISSHHTLDPRIRTP